MRILLLGAIIVLALNFSQSVPAQTQAYDKFSPVREKIKDVMAYWDIASVAVAVSYKGNVVWEEAFGYSDRERHIPATVHTLYSLASISKPITATAIMTLVDQGKIDLDRPANDYLGASKLVSHFGDAEKATVRLLLNHTAGLNPGHLEYFYADQSSGHQPPMDETIAKYGGIVLPVGERYAYSNLDYGILGYIIERQSHRSFGDFLKSSVFEPLGLTEATVSPDVNETPEVAKRYWFGAQKLPDYEVDTPGATTVFMSAHDVLLFGLYHLHGVIPGQHKSILTQSAIAEMQKPVPLNNGKMNAEYGLGWEIRERHGLKSFGHSGGMAGVASRLLMYPTDDLVVVVIANGVSETGAIHYLDTDIVHAVLPQTIVSDDGFKPPSQLIGHWQGQIQTDAVWYGQKHTIAATSVDLTINENGEISVRFGSGPGQAAENVKMNAETFAITMDGLWPFLDGSGHTSVPGEIKLDLAPRQPGVLTGYVQLSTASSFKNRMGNTNSYWAELKRDGR